jgi:hypothetical protein
MVNSGGGEIKMTSSAEDWLDNFDCQECGMRASRRKELLAAEARVKKLDALLAQCEEALGMGNQYALADMGEYDDRINSALAAIRAAREKT